MGSENPGSLPGSFMFVSLFGGISLPIVAGERDREKRSSQRKMEKKTSAGIPKEVDHIDRFLIKFCKRFFALIVF